ncbi:transcription initiation factor TFIID subunit 8-like [Trichogramma pretiosum]|uniref:transcription initiation factor TFIID subunit 8-like n=1 Tax=Trichogramma pretiosum TaxID=7493 RepID=UPI0006C98A82|nr:transcription initiation factor TFIID subunit 8-like [Trichogramma pretiosum]
MDQQITNSRRKILSHAIACLIHEAGFETCEKAALETLTEMCQSFITDLGTMSRNYCELSGRTEVLIADVILALTNSGIRVDNLNKYVHRPNRSILPPLQVQTQQKQLNILQAGVKQNHPPHIPSHLPPLPDPHAYIRTPTHKQPVTEYEAIREKAAQQKRDIERALTRFTAKTQKTHSLFLKDDNSMFPLIACTPQFPTYLSALLPQDQIFDEDSDVELSPKKKKEQSEVKPTKDGTRAEEGETKKENDKNEESEENSTQTEAIDNPYLRPSKMPKIKISAVGKNLDNSIIRN